MNAAARAINQSNVFNGRLMEIRLSKELLTVLILVVSFLASALAVVYITNTYRLSLSQLEQTEQQAHQLQSQWGQLLLEQASLARPARVEELATDKLKMTLPEDKNTYVLQAR